MLPQLVLRSFLLVFATALLSSLSSLSSSLPAVAQQQQLETELQIHSKYAAAAYCSDSAVQDWSCKPHCTSSPAPPLRIVEHINHIESGLLAYVGVDDAHSKVIVSFRGSKDPRNWAYNLRFAKADYVYGDEDGDTALVHGGFVDAFKVIGEPLINKVIELATTTPLSSRSSSNRRAAHHPNQQQSSPPVEVVVTGHSLGGALATLMALQLTRQLSTIVSDRVRLTLSTFGQPRIGNDAFALLVHRRLCNTKSGGHRCYRVTANRDIVTQLPPMMFDFKHHPHEVYLTKSIILSSGNLFEERWVMNDKCSDMYIDPNTPDSEYPIEDGHCASGHIFYDMASHLSVWNTTFTSIC
ncbi:alpha/beta-hydrolase [Ramicandelaber brevisporus]|nr:alpha/beta-hydrolase [Ramicandelaber brevisporus]